MPAPWDGMVRRSFSGVASLSLVVLWNLAPGPRGSADRRAVLGSVVTRISKAMLDHRDARLTGRSLARDVSGLLVLAQSHEL